MSVGPIDLVSEGLTTMRVFPSVFLLVAFWGLCVCSGLSSDFVAEYLLKNKI